MLTKRSVEPFVSVTKKIDESPIKRVDLDVDGWSVDTYSLALFNDYKFWCRSSAYDYIRRPNFGGFFDGWLRAYSMDAAGEKKVEDDLREKTNEAFGENLELLNVEAKCDRNQRYWTVKVTPYDKLSSIAGKSKDGSNLIANVSSENGFIEAGQSGEKLNNGIEVRKSERDYHL